MLLKHRRLFCLSLLAILSVFLAEALPHETKAVFFWSLLLPLPPLLILALKYRRVRVLLFALILATGAFFSSYQVSNKQNIAEELAIGETERYSVTLSSSSSKKGDAYTAEGHLMTVSNGKTVRLRVKISSPDPAQAGDVLFGEGRFSAFEKGSYNAADGYYGTVVLFESQNVDRLTTPRYALGRLRTVLSEHLCQAAPREGGALLCALLLGVRDGLPDSFTRDMERIGTTHMLSLSGMHLAVLTAGIAFLLRRLRIGRRIRVLLLSLFVASFMLLTGLSVSVMRAGFMFFLSALPLFLREERDGLSSLAAAVAVICLCEPYATRDLSLWLSALATLGILLFFERQKRTEHRPLSPMRRAFRAISLSLSVTLAATVATLPLTLCAFGTLPLLSPLANLILSPLVQLALYLSLFLTFLGSVSFLSQIATALCNLIFTISSFLGDVPRTVLSFTDSFTLYLVFAFVTALLLYFLLCPRKRFLFRVPVALCVSCAISVGATLGTTRLLHYDELSVTCFSDIEEETDAILFRYKGDRLLTVFSDFGKVGTAEYAALAEVAGEVDGFLVPYYTDGTAHYLKSLLNESKIYRLYLPAPSFAYEREIYAEILKIAKDAAVPTVAFDKDTPFFFGFLTVSCLLPTNGDGYAPDVFAEFLFGYDRIGYFSANAVGFSLRADALCKDLLIFGACGAPLQRRFLREEFIDEQARVLCPSPHLFPFTNPSGIVFSCVSQAYLPMRTEIS